MCGRTCVGVTSGKKDRMHALRTHILEVISHAPAHVRPHIARVRARTFATHTLTKIQWPKNCSSFQSDPKALSDPN